LCVVDPDEFAIGTIELVLGAADDAVAFLGVDDRLVAELLGRHPAIL
jgi:hypothetical protein